MDVSPSVERDGGGSAGSECREPRQILNIGGQADRLEPAAPMAELFAGGNYVAVARDGGDDDWRTHAARGLIGRYEAALEGLARFDHAEARFAEAVTRFIAGDEWGAARLLERSSAPTAQALLALVRSERIRVLVQSPRVPGADLVQAFAADDLFDVREVDLADVHRSCDAQRPPDLYVCALVERHLIPQNLHELPCPTFGHTADPLRCVQTVPAALPLFDGVLVPDESAWRDAGMLTAGRALTFPKWFFPDEPPALGGERPIDVVVCGAPALLPRLAELAGLDVRLCDASAPRSELQALLGHAKVAVLGAERPGATLLAADALRIGCAVVVPQTSPLRLYAGEEAGVLTEAHEGRGLARTIELVLANWPEFARRAEAGATIVTRELALGRVASEYLRFLTVQAAHVGPEVVRRRRATAPPRSSRSPWRGWSSPAAVETRRRSDVAFWSETMRRDPGPRALTELARELLLGGLDEGRTLALVLDLHRTGVERFPDALLVRFNAVRIALHFGRSAQVLEGVQLAEATLAESPAPWRLDPLEDVLPAELFGSGFNYRRYLRLAAAASGQGRTAGDELVQLVRASLHHYVGCARDDAHHLAEAVRLDLEFAPYRAGLARHLVRQGGATEQARAIAVLEELARDAMCAAEALALLHALGATRLGGGVAEALGRLGATPDVPCGPWPPRPWTGGGR